MTYVTTKVKTVYRAVTGRTYLTRLGAYEACAYAAINRRIERVNGAPSKWCDCQDADYDYDGREIAHGYACRYHDEAARKKLAKRLARWMMWRDSRAIGGAHG